MKFFTALLLCFVFANPSDAQGGGYARRQRGPIFSPINPGPTIQHNPGFGTPQAVHTGPGVGHSQQWGNNNAIGLLSRRHDVLPPEIARLEGSTITGQVMVGGQNGFPQHGGVMNEEGIIGGWGRDENVQLNTAVSNWNSPFGDAAYPENYAGQELVYDSVNNRHIIKGQDPKLTNFITPQKGHIMPGPTPFDQSSIIVEHNIVKDASHVAGKAISGISPVGGAIIDPTGHHVEAKIVGQQTHNIAKVQNHDIVKSSGVISAGKPDYLSRKPKTAAVVGQTHPTLLTHNVNKATLGSAAATGHNIAKAASNPSGIGFINPNGPIATSLGGGHVAHGIAKASSEINIIGHDVLGGPVGGNPIGTPAIIGHHSAPGSPLGVALVGDELASGQFGVHQPVHKPATVQDPVHRVNKVGQSGIARIGHDPLAAEIGHSVAKGVIRDSAHIIDTVSGGGVSHGDPFAVAATHGLAKESVQVAGQTLHAASPGNPIIHGSHVGTVQPKPIFNQGPVVGSGLPVHPKPVFPQPVHHIGGGHVSSGSIPVHPKPVYPEPVKPVKPVKPVYPEPVKPVNSVYPEPVKHVGGGGHVSGGPIHVQPKPVFTQTGGHIGGGQFGGSSVHVQPKPVFTQTGGHIGGGHFSGSSIHVQPKPVFTQPKPVVKQPSRRRSRPGGY